MAFQVSPGINVSEVDLTAGAQQVSVSDAAFAGPFSWGPALEATNIGSEDDLVKTFGKPTSNNYAYWFSAQSFLAYSNLLHVVRAISAGALNSTVDAKALSGTVDANVALHGFKSNAGFTTTGLVVGQKLKISGVTYTVNSVSNSTAFTTVETTNAEVGVAVASYGLLIKNSTHYDATYSSGIAGYGAWAAKYVGDLGNALKVSICTSANAFAQGSLAGTIATTAGSNVVTGVGTSFNTVLTVGDYLDVNGMQLQVASITNSTQVILATNALKTTAATSAWSREWEYADLFDGAPGTSDWATDRAGSLDEMHVVVVDKTGKFTGTAGTVLERYAFLSKAGDAKNANGENNYYKDVLNRQSAYIWWLTAPGTNNSNFGLDAAGVTFGVDSLPETKTLIGGQTDNANIQDADIETGYDLFKNADQIDISLVITGPVSAAVASYIIQNVCESRADCMAFVSPTSSSVVNNPGSEVTSIVSFRNSLPSSSYAALDSNWKYTYDKYNDKFRWVPCNGDIAGIAARSDSATDPWFSPAGFNRGNLKNVVKLAWNPKQVDRDDLYKAGVNPIVTFPGQGTILYGDKTLLSRPSAFDRINVRRLFIVIEKTISRLARTQLFEFNDEFTRTQFRNIVEPYLRDVKARRGITDYRVICDDSNNTDEVVQENRFIGDIYVKPARSINFIQLNFVAVRNGVSFQEVTGAV